MIEKEQAKLDISNALITLLILSSFFPFIQIIPLGTDSQPYALMVSMIILPFYFTSKINLSLFLLLIIAVFSVGMLFFSEFDFGSIRSLVNYVSLFVISYVTYKCMNFTGGLNYNIFREDNTFYVIVSYNGGLYNSVFGEDDNVSFPPIWDWW